MARVDVVVHGCLHATDVVTRPERASRRRAKLPTSDADDDDDAMMVGNGPLLHSPRLRRINNTSKLFKHVNFSASPCSCDVHLRQLRQGVHDEWLLCGVWFASELICTLFPLWSGCVYQLSLSLHPSPPTPRSVCTASLPHNPNTTNQKFGQKSRTTNQPTIPKPPIIFIHNGSLQHPFHPSDTACIMHSTC